MSETHPSRIPSACPCCGAYALASTTQPSALLAVADVLVIKTLEQVGRRIVNGGPRSRRGQWNGRPFHLAHTLWPADATMTSRALAGAWDVVPAMLDVHGCCGVTSHDVVTMLDDYVADLLVTGTEHNLTDLRYRFESRLALTFPQAAVGA